MPNRKQIKKMPDGYVAINESQTGFCNSNGDFLKLNKSGNYINAKLKRIGGNRSLSVCINGFNGIASRYVAIAFCNYKGQKIDYLDGNVYNVAASNLLFSTRSERQKIKRAAQKKPKAPKVPKVKPLPKPIIMVEPLMVEPPKKEVKKVRAANAVRLEFNPKSEDQIFDPKTRYSNISSIYE